MSSWNCGKFKYVSDIGTPQIPNTMFSSHVTNISLHVKLPQTDTYGIVLKILLLEDQSFCIYFELQVEQIRSKSKGFFFSILFLFYWFIPIS